MNIDLIGGKTEFEILSMGCQKRYLWYKMILPEEKEKAMGIVEIVRRNKNSVAMIKWWREPGYRARFSGKNGYLYGKNNPAKRLDVRAKLSIAKIKNWKDSEFRASRTGNNNPAKRPEVRAKMSASMIEYCKTSEAKDKMSANNTGENNPNFNNWVSRKPYCYLWNESLRERYRNYWGRVCVLTDTLRSVMGLDSGLSDFEGHEIFSKRRLAVHHSRGDKMEGCNGKEMALVPIQNRFNNKKFDGLRLENHPFYITLFLFKDIERKHREECWR